MNKSGPRGPRPGRPDTRADVLAVARRRFFTDGYDAVTMRSVANEAGVDVALISYYFGSKRGLFAAALDLAASPPDVLRSVLPGDLATLPERVLHALVATWDTPGQGDRLQLMITAAVQEPEIAKLLREMLEREIITVLIDRLRGDDAAYRAAAFATQLGGLIFARYLLRVEPIASMSADEIVRYLAPPLRVAMRPHPRPLTGAR